MRWLLLLIAYVGAEVAFRDAVRAARARGRSWRRIALVVGDSEHEVRRKVGMSSAELRAHAREQLREAAVLNEEPPDVGGSSTGS